MTPRLHRVTAKVTAEGTLAPHGAFAAVLYSIGWFDGPVFSSGPTNTNPYFQQNYVFVRQPCSSRGRSTEAGLLDLLVAAETS